MRAALISILVIAAVLVGGGLVASVAYQAGVQANVTTVPVTTDRATAVTPVVVAPYGYGYGWGFGHSPFSWVFGFFAFLFFLFIVFGIIRALTWRGRGGPGGWGGRGGPGYWGGRYGDHEPGSHPFEGRARQHFEEWHRSAHGEPPASAGPSPSPSPTTTPPAS